MRKFPAVLRKQFSAFKKLNTPAKVQDFVNALRVNFEEDEETCASPRAVLGRRKAHCIEGALLAAAAFWYHGRPPLILDLKTTDDDDDHVVALFKEGGRWGAVSKTNHAVLRYREPVFRDVRELAMSYFSEYFLDSGKKTMRSYSTPFDLSRIDPSWLTAAGNLWKVNDAIDRSRHVRIVSEKAARRLRRADPVERRAGKVVAERRRR